MTYRPAPISKEAFLAAVKAPECHPVGVATPGYSLQGEAVLIVRLASDGIDLSNMVQR